MSAENVERLCALAKAGDREAEQDLWERAVDFARKRARPWVGRGGAGADDLRQAAWIALHETIRRRQQGRGFWTLYGLMLRSAYAEAAYGGRSQRLALDPLQTAASLDAPAKADGDTTLLELLADRAAAETAEPLDSVNRSELAAAVRRAVSRADLTPPERRIIALRYQRGLCREQAARVCGISPTAGKRLEERALRKLRHPDVSRPLRIYGLGL